MVMSRWTSEATASSRTRQPSRSRTLLRRRSAISSSTSGRVTASPSASQRLRRNGDARLEVRQLTSVTSPG